MAIINWENEYNRCYEKLEMMEDDRDNLFKIINKLQHFAIEHNLDMEDCEDISDAFINYIENKEWEETELPLSNN